MEFLRWSKSSNFAAKLDDYGNGKCVTETKRTVLTRMSKPVSTTYAPYKGGMCTY